MITKFLSRKTTKTTLVILILFGLLLTLLPNVISASPLPFTDVDPADWFYEQVRDVFEQGLMRGTDDMTFSPDMSVTRAMAVQVIFNLNGEPGMPSWITNPFTDVAEGAWYHDAVVWAAAQDIVRGFGDGTFAPGDYITRAHLTIMLNRYADFASLTLPPRRDSQPFTDYMDIRNYAKEAIDRFFRGMVINGRPDGSFDPQGNATRAELATMLSQFVRYSESIAVVTPPPYGVFPPSPMPSPEPPPMPEYGFPHLD